MTYAVGSLVKARGREWVVLPESEEDMLVLRPLGSTEYEVAGIYLPLEPVEPATFDLPDPTRRGDYRSSRLRPRLLARDWRYPESRLWWSYRGAPVRA